MTVTGPDAPAGRRAETDPATALAVVRELARRFSVGDAAGSFALFHPGVRIEQPASLPHGGWHEGRDGVAQMGATFGGYWDRTIRDVRILPGAPPVVQLTTQTWTAKSTGRSATVDVVELIEVTDGLISEIRVFQQDTRLLLDTLDAG